MKNKLLIILIAIIGILLTGLIGVGKLYQREHNERIRTEGNQTALLTDIEHFKTADSLNAVKIQTLELTRKELEQSNIGFQETIDKLNIKNKRLLSLTQVSTETKIEFKTIRKDSLIYVPGKDSLVKIECLEYKDPYVEFSGCYDAQDSFSANIFVPIRLDIVGTYVPKQFWFIKYGFDHAELSIISDNKYTDITYAQSVELKKKRRKRR